jgi:acyl-CoA synthetase (AMP-forming)/AMP-acid ligase II
MSKDNGVLHDTRSAKTFPQLLRAAAAAHGNAVAIALEDASIPDERMTFIELERKSAELARGLIARGIGKGARVAFIYGNSPGFALLLAAVCRIGAIAIPVSTMIKANELVRVMRQSDATGLIVQRHYLGNDYVDRLCAALPELRADGTGADLRLNKTPYLRWIISSGSALPPSIQHLGSLLDGARSVSEELLLEIEAEVHPADQMLEIYTSGSMALPKGVRHNHGPILFRTHYLRSMLNPAPGKRIVVQLPMFWVGGLMMYLLPNLEVGATSVCTERTLSNSRVAMGSVLAADDLALMAQAKPYWSLGMSETLGPYAYADVLRAPNYPLCAPLDHIAERFEVRVADEAGQQVGEGATGEIQVRGYALTPGLHKVERSEYFTADGFYRTGDMGLVEGSRIHFIGRNGDIIKTAGATVSPAEVEMELQELDGVHSAYVVGVPDAERGQMLVAVVVPRQGAKLDFDRLQETLRKRLSSYKVPRAYLSIGRDEVPLLHSNKVARRQLQAWVAKRLGVTI